MSVSEKMLLEYAFKLAEHIFHEPVCMIDNIVNIRLLFVILLIFRLFCLLKTSSMYVHDVTIFRESHFCSVHRQ